MSDSVRPHRQQPTRLPCPWDSPGKNTGVGCHFLLQCMKVKSESQVARSCLSLCDSMDCSLPGFSVHGIFQARVLEWGAIAFSERILEKVNICIMIKASTTIVTLFYNCFCSLYNLRDSFQFSRSLMSDSLQPHGLQHARPSCPSLTPGVYSNSYPLSR